MDVLGMAFGVGVGAVAGLSVSRLLGMPRHVNYDLEYREW